MNQLALAVRPLQFNPAEPLMAAAQLRAADAQNELAKIKVGEAQAERDAGFPTIQKNKAEADASIHAFRMSRLGQEARALLPLANKPEFATEWAKSIDRLATEKIISPERAADLRKSPNALMLQRVLAETSSLEAMQKQQGLEMGNRIAAGIGGALTGNDPRGIRNNNPLNIEAGQFTQRQPGFTGSDGRFAQFETPQAGLNAADKLLQSYSSRGIDTIAGVVNRWAPPSDNNPTTAYADFVARKVGVAPGDKIDLNDPQVRSRVVSAMAEFENGRPVNLPTSLNPQTERLQAMLPQLQQALLIPSLPEGTRKGIESIVSSLSKNVEPTGEMKEYGLYVAQSMAAGQQPKSLLDWQKELNESRRSQVNIDQRQESQFRKDLGSGLAKQFNEMAEDGIKAADDRNLYARLGELLQQSGTGTGVAFANFVRENTGIKLSEKADAAEAANALINYLMPRMRVPGTGASSDRDLQAFGRALPSLLSTPEGKNVVIETLGGMAQARQERGDIAMRVQMEELRPKEAIAEIRKLEDPFKGFKEYQGGNKAPKPADPATAPAKVNTKAEYDKLPAGTKYIAPDGSERVKQ